MSAATGTADGLTLPLSPAIRKAYEELYDLTQVAIETTADGALLQTLNDVQQAIGAVISADNRYRIEQNTALFEALFKQICDVNESLKKLKEQIAGIAKTTQLLADLTSQIQNLLSIIP